MKTLQINSLVYMLAVTMASGSLVACAQATTGGATTSAPTTDPGKSQLLQPMQTMVEKLKKLQATGDPDFDYAFQVKIHTQGEQDLLKQEIQNGKDSSIRQMAQSLLTTTQSDMNLIDGALKEIRPSRPNQAFTQQQSRNVQAMALKLQPGGTPDKLTGTFDKNFLAVLLDHRQDAIDMANTYLQYGKNATLKDYAQKLVAKAQVEMTQAKSFIPKQN